MNIQRLFKWNLTKETWIAFGVGIGIICLSVLMIPLKNNLWLYIFDRDIVMVLLVGITFPLFYISKENKFNEYGFHAKHWFIYLIINLLLGALLLLMFLKESSPGPNFRITGETGWNIFYIMMTGIFEVVVFYSFLRTIFEKSFGIVPAIILAALFYSFHHAGFQPEFVKLFFVGVLFATIFRMANSALLIYPFFWGVGASYDVLVQSKVAGEIAYPEVRSIILFAGIVLISLLLFHKVKYVKTIQSNS